MSSVYTVVNDLILARVIARPFVEIAAAAHGISQAQFDGDSDACNREFDTAGKSQ